MSVSHQLRCGRRRAKPSATDSDLLPVHLRPQPAAAEDLADPADRSRARPSELIDEDAPRFATGDRFEAFEKMRFVRLGGDGGTSRKWDDQGVGGAAGPAGGGGGRGRGKPKPRVMEAKKEAFPTADVVRCKYTGIDGVGPASVGRHVGGSQRRGGALAASQEEELDDGGM